MALAILQHHISCHIHTTNTSNLPNTPQVPNSPEHGVLRPDRREAASDPPLQHGGDPTGLRDRPPRRRDQGHDTRAATGR